MRIYLDTSVYNRPFDDQRQARIWLESMALSAILKVIESGDAELISSSVIAYETSRNPYEQRRRWVERVTQMAKVEVAVTAAIRRRAQELETAGIKPIDALHVAAAESIAADYFLTVDDRLIRRYRQLADAKLTATDPVTFVREISDEDLE